MKMYSDQNKDFFYVEKNGVWYEQPYESEKDEWREIPPIKHIEHAGLIEEKIFRDDLPEWLTDCKDCDNSGFLWDDDELLECGCYHTTETNRKKVLDEM